MASLSTPSRPTLTWRRCFLWAHLVCGLVIALYAIVLGLTGSILVFREELSALSYPEFHRVNGVPESGATTPDAVLEQARTAFAGWQPVSLTWPNEDSPHWMVYLIHGSDSREAYFDTTGTQLGARDVNGDWIGWLLRTHVNFQLGTTGRKLNGYGACVLIGLCLTGLILWWPTGGSGAHPFAARLRIDFRSGWRRLAWQLHHSTGILSLVFIAILAFTGGYYIWMQDYIKVVDRFFDRSTDPKVPAHPAGSSLMSLTELARITQQQLPGLPLYRAAISSAGFPVRITALEGRPQQFHRVSSVALDPVTGSVLQLARLDDRPTGNSILSWFSVLHFGRFGGDGIGFWLVKISWALLSLSLPLLAITGCMMWWKRVIEPRLKKSVAPRNIEVPEVVL